MRPFLIICLASLLSGRAQAATLSDLSVGDLLITEIHANPAATTRFRGQWMEIYNASGSTVNLQGLVVKSGLTESFTISSSLNLAAGDYAVFAARSSSTANGGLPAVDYAYSTTAFNLTAGGDTVSLTFGGTTFDAVDYTPLDFPDPYGASLSLSPDSFGDVLNDDGDSWCEPYNTYGLGDAGTPGSDNDDCAETIDALGAGDLIITEVMHTPLASAYNKGEWFEIYNASSTFVDLDGLVIDGASGEQIVISESLTVAPGGYLVFAARDTSISNGGIPKVDRRYVYSTEMILSSSDTLTLSYGVTVFDDLTWNSAIFPNVAGVAMELGTNEYDSTLNDTAANWCGASLTYGSGDYGSPGSENSDCDPDTDNDGYAEDVDCDDDDASINPGEDEVCDGIDNDCDGSVDDSPVDGTTYYADVDKDYYGSALSTVQSCSRPTGYRTNSLDCNDANAAIKPGAAETCNGTDNNCSGSESDASDASLWYPDSDIDGYGLTASVVASCTQPGGYIAQNGDCNDASSAIYPGAAETCNGTDNNCSGSESDASDVSTYYADVDKDLYGSALSTVQSCSRPTGYRTNSLDCNDANAAIKPGVAETCDGTDNNCSGNENDASNASTWYADADGDAYGDADEDFKACSQPGGYQANDDDCDDGSAAVYPGAAETCDGTDNNCSGDEDDASDRSTFYADVDYDFFGDASSTVDACERPNGYRTNGLDCDDTDDGIKPNAAETCDGTDNNCSGDELDASDITTWFADDDGDTFGDASDSTESCDQPGGYLVNDDDCDDTSAAVYPGAAETCDGTDNNCSGDEDDASDTSTWYADADGDTYGNAGVTTAACDQPGGYQANDDDCDDAAAAVYPGAAETCDGTDNNCSGDELDALDVATWYADTDGDLYGDVSDTTDACDQPGGYADNGDDCDDADADINPGESELCDGTDDNCSGDELDAVDITTWYSDTDGDTYGDANYSMAACDQPDDYVINDDDCDDGEVGVYPGAAEVCDGTDNNCSGDESDASDTTTWYADGDGDSYGDPLDTSLACVQPGGHVGNDDDCDDGAAAVSPAADEVCADGTDSDCDGFDSNAVCEADLGGVDATFTGEAAADRSGYAIDGGDINGDGISDVVIGARLTDDAGADAGSTYVYFGPLAGSYGLSGADTQINGESAGDYFSFALAADGDVDNDGYDDLLIGATNEDQGGSDAGAAYLVLGPISGTAGIASATDAKLYGTGAGDNAGRTLDWAGDFDDDGYDDFIVGSYANDDAAINAGAAYLFLGPVSSDGSLDDADLTFTGVAAQDFAGYQVAGGGDSDADGFDEVLVNSYRADTVVEGNTIGNVGITYLINGSASASGVTSLSLADTAFIGIASTDQAGQAVAFAGDVNYDGYDDVLIGAQQADDAGTSSGTTYLLYGPFSATEGMGDADATFTGEAASDFSGRAVDGIGDINGDNYEDFLVGAKTNDNAASDAGAAYLFLGPVSGTISLAYADAVLLGETSNDQAGIAVAGAGDVSGDGSPDALIGAVNGGGGSEPGITYLLLGDSWR